MLFVSNIRNGKILFFISSFWKFWHTSHVGKCGPVFSNDSSSVFLTVIDVDSCRREADL